jgi:hypothetical protein
MQELRGWAFTGGRSVIKTMRKSPSRASTVIVGVGLIGIGILFATDYWQPGLSFLVAVCAILEGWLHRERLWYAIQIGYWFAIIGVLALVGFNLVFLLVALGAGAILAALVSPGPLSKPKPLVDSSLE